MGPPPRPVEGKAEKEEKERITDISDISDVIFGSGVDLREEENYMMNTFRNSHSQNSYGTSFGSDTTGPSANSSFNHLSQGQYQNQPAFRGSGPTSQTASSQESIEAELNRKHRAAALNHAKQHEQHLRDPFLYGNTVRHRMHRIALDQGVTLDIKGLYDPNTGNASNLPKRPQDVTGTKMTGPDGSGIVAIKAESVVETKAHALLEDGAKYADVLALISLATNERLRGLLGDAYSSARGRRYGSHGVVPPDMQDLAVGETKQSSTLVPQSITETSWDQVPEQGGSTEGEEKKPSESDLISLERVPPTDQYPDTAQPTVSFTSSLTTHLHDLAISDRNAEHARIRKRQERARKAANASNADSAMADGDVTLPASGTPDGGTGTSTPDPSSQVAPEKAMSKKERERQSKMGQTEEVLHKNANATAAMALGFGKKKKYSWITGGAAAAPTNPFARPAAPTVKTESGARAAGGANGDTSLTNGTNGAGTAGAATKSKSATPVHRGLQATERKWGSWREDGIQGRGIQGRDLVVVLERDGRERKALQKCLLRLEEGEGQ